MGRKEDEIVENAEASTLAIEAFVTSRVAWVLGNRGRCRMLFHIADNDGMTVREVASRAGVDQHYAYQHVKRLKQRGWISSKNRGPSKVYRCSNNDIRKWIMALRGVATDPFLGSRRGDSAQASVGGSNVEPPDEK